MSHSRRSFLGAFLLAALFITCAGCQTFSLSEDDFRRQQQGKEVDPETGKVVSVAGTAGAYGAMLGEAVAKLVGK